MFGLRQKLGLGFGGLLMILILMGLLSRAALHRYSATLDRIFRENYDSVLYGQQMKDAVERMDDAAQAAAYGIADAAAPAPQQLLTQFETNLQAEQRNITLPHEGDLARQLNELWNGRAGIGGQPALTSYRQQFLEMIRPGGDPAVLRGLYRSQFLPQTLQLETAAQSVIDINIQNMGFANGQVKQSAADAERTIFLLIAAGVVLGVVFVAFISRSILKAVTGVTQSAREIERGNLDLLVPVTSRDEMGQLAETFNAMAGRLRDFRRTDRAKLLRTQRTTSLALGSLPDAVAVISPEGKVELSNESAQRWFGLKPDADLASASEPALAALFRQAVTQQRPIKPRGYDSAIQIFNGQEQFFLPTVIPVMDEEHNLAGVTLVLADVTSLRKLDEMKSGLISVVSHELKNPLTSIRMATHVLLEERVGPLNEKQVELLSAAKDDSDRLYEIIENLLDMGRIESGRALINLQPVSPERLSSDAINRALPAFRDKGVSLANNVSVDLPRVMVDPDRISHVFSNLLDNALKYTGSGGSVAITAALQDQRVQFSVSDTGTGITAEALPRVFERFYRAPGQPGQTGAGLGLAISKEIVEVHGGTISAQSNTGQGSLFSFNLPVENNHE